MGRQLDPQPVVFLERAELALRLPEQELGASLPPACLLPLPGPVENHVTGPLILVSFTFHGVIPPFCPT